MVNSLVSMGCRIRADATPTLFRALDANLRERRRFKSVDRSLRGSTGRYISLDGLLYGWNEWPTSWRNPRIDQSKSMQWCTLPTGRCKLQRAKQAERSKWEEDTQLAHIIVGQLIDLVTWTPGEAFPHASALSLHY